MAKAVATNCERPSSAMKSPCVTCSKPIGVLRCEGCQNVFCIGDLNQHRNELSNQLDELAAEHNGFQQTLSQTAANLRTHALVRRIDAWEKESKHKIRQIAEEARQQVETHAATNMNEISVRFREMVERLQEVRKENTFDERDLKQWAEQLEQLKENFTTPSIVSVAEENGEFIKKITVTDLEVLGRKFEHVSGGYAQLTDGGMGVTFTYNTNQYNYTAQIRGKGEYSRGVHKIPLRIEAYNNGLIFFGVNSKSTPMLNNNCGTASSYGWTAGTTNAVYMYGQCFNNYKDYVSDYAVNDIVELEFDCYRRLIRLRNQRSKKQYEMTVDLKKCPFPWVLQLNINYYGTRLSILPQTNF